MLVIGRAVKFLENKNVLGQDEIVNDQPYIEIIIQDEAKTKPLTK